MWPPSFTLKTQTGWGLGSYFSDDGNLAFPTSLFPALRVPVFFLLPLPGRVPRSPSHHPSSSVLLAQTLLGSAAPLQHSCLLPALILSHPFQMPLVLYPATCQNHDLSEPLSSTNKGQIFLAFPSKFLTLLASLPFSFPPFHPFFSLSGFFSFLPLLLHSGVWTELRITNVCLEKPYLKQTKEPVGWFEVVLATVFTSFQHGGVSPFPLAPSASWAAQRSSRANF